MSLHHFSHDNMAWAYERSRSRAPLMPFTAFLAALAMFFFIAWLLEGSLAYCQ